MNTFKTRFLRCTLDSMYYSGAYKLLERVWSGIGVIFTLHRIRPACHGSAFSPNRILDITPEFLDQTIRYVLDRGYDIVDLDEVRNRLVEGNFQKKFVCFTFDDGYVDHCLAALPIFRKYQVPFTVYITPGFCDSTAVHWWQHLENVIAWNNKVEMALGTQEFSLAARTTKEKYRAFSLLYWALRAAPHAVQQSAIDRMLDVYTIDAAAFCRQVALSWEMVRELSQSNLATIGAHTMNHHALSKLSAEQVAWEATESRRVLARHLDAEPQHFAYPYGDQHSAGPREFNILKELGFATATTTRKGVIFPEHANHLHALPRISLNGDYQVVRYLPVFLSGAPFALWNRFRRLDVN
jgi:peptidoglycan/xylan/chitin deacetylase (PgdA/CDA1 family)